VKTLLGFKMAL